MMGFRIMTNFNLPYLAHDIRDFWRRWHISLSTWLRDYLYIPLGGSRRGRSATYRNLMITMALGGLWHGAAWKFVIWGVYHGVLLALNRVRIEIFGKPKREVTFLSLRWWVGAFITFHLVCLGWVFFRGNSMASIGVMLSRLAALHFSGPFEGTFAMVGVALGASSHILNGRYDLRYMFLRWPSLAQSAVYATAVLLLALFSSTEKAFIYFQF
jgi:D-alanyl-lipoteichoic acid acyltransferase DltB (MBOAT superfamily)